jgi:hypothetical protein
MRDLRELDAAIRAFEEHAAPLGYRLHDFGGGTHIVPQPDWWTKDGRENLIMVITLDERTTHV